MKVFKDEIKQMPIGIWMAIIALVMIMLAWLMQAYSLVDWEGAVQLGIQENSFLGNDTDRVMADVERGIAIADMVWALPITIVAFIGLLRKKLIGFICAMMVFSICVYFPLFYAFRLSMHFEIVLIAMILWAMPSLFGIVGLWKNRSFFSIK